jgi:protein SCO1/2
VTARSRRGQATLAFAAAVALAACSNGGGAPAKVEVVGAAGESSGLHGTSVGDVIPRPALALLDTEGQRFDLRRRSPNEITVLFFGYTHCQDVCPTVMADLASARRQLPRDVAKQVSVVFVTEDPARDTPAVLRAWLRQFDSSFVGLLGGGVRTSGVLKALRAPVTEPGRTPALLEHTGSVYVFAGKTVVVYTGGTTPTEYATELTALLKR